MFVHLHNHSEFSLLDGAIKVYEMAARAAKLGMPALALTDHGNMYGSIDFYKACRKHNVKPIMGVEVYVSPEGMENKVPSANYYHLVLLAENNRGYENIMGLVTESNIRGFYYKPRVDYETLAKYSDGVLALTACISGEVPERLLLDDEKGAKEALGKYKEIFEGRVWVELQNHEMPEEIRVIPRLLDLAREFNLPVVGTQDAHYLEHSDAEAHDILLCIQTLTKQDDPDRMRFANGEFYMKTPAQMERIFDYVPEAINNTLEIAERCNVNIELGKPHPPKFTDIKDDDPAAHVKFLEGLVEEGAKWRFGENPSNEVRERLDYELKVVEQTGFVDYFLVVWDFIKYAKERQISVGPGRGSGAASLVSYCLNITDVNPLEYGLFFERFLNAERISPPDFDIDFDDVRRDEVIKYVTQKYGEDSVAQVATFGRMEARAVLRDVGRALGFPYQDMDKIAKLVPFGADLDEALSTVPQLKEIEGQGERNKKLFEVARRLEGVVRNFSTHAAGVVMADKPLYHYVPLQLDKEGKRVTQFEKNAIEELGILKVDFLGLRNLSVMERTIKLVKERTSNYLDLDKIPLNDQPTYEALKVGDTMGVFQLESAGMRRYLRELKPTDVSDLVAMVALFRPGPMQFIPDFIAGKHGERAFNYLDPSLEPILAPTYGIVVYQEQVLQIARDFAGFTLGQADILRKAMGKKIPELLAQQKEQFIKKAVGVGRDAKVADEVFKFIEPFAGYGFNKAHATCYGLLAYKTAYLKTHYKLEYYTSILTSYIGNEDRIKEWYEECRRSGIELLPPDINSSFTAFNVEENKIRYALAALKNVGEAAVEIIIKERGKGKFKSFEEFVQRIDSTKVNKKVIESLIKAGAFESLGINRNIYNDKIEEEIKRNISAFRIDPDSISRLRIDSDIIKKLCEPLPHSKIPDPLATSLMKQVNQYNESLKNQQVIDNSNMMEQFKHFNNTANSIYEAANITKMFEICENLNKPYKELQQTLQDSFKKITEIPNPLIAFKESMKQLGEAIKDLSGSSMLNQVSEREANLSIQHQETIKKLAKPNFVLQKTMQDQDTKKVSNQQLAPKRAEMPEELEKVREDAIKVAADSEGELEAARKMRTELEELKKIKEQLESAQTSYKMMIEKQEELFKKINKKLEEIPKDFLNNLNNLERGGMLKQYGGQGSNGSSFSLFDMQKPVEEKKTTPKEEILRMEKEILGFYMSDHPMRPYEKYLQNEEHTEIARLADVEDDQSVTIMGIITGHKRSKSKKGSPIATCTVEDLSGICQIIAFGRAYEPISEILDQEGIVAIKGRVESRDGQPRIVAEEVVKVIKPSDLVKNGKEESYNVNVLVNLETQFHLLEKIKLVIAQHGPGNNPLVLHLQKAGKKMTMESEKEFWVKDQNTVLKIKEIVGPNQVWLSPRSVQ